MRRIDDREAVVGAERLHAQAPVVADGKQVQDDGEARARGRAIAEALVVEGAEVDEDREGERLVVAQGCARLPRDRRRRPGS